MMTRPIVRNHAIHSGQTAARVSRIPIVFTVLVCLIAPFLPCLESRGGGELTQTSSSEIRAIHILRHPSYVTAFGFQPNNQMLLTLDRQAVLRSWDLRTGQMVSEIESGSGGLSIGVFSPDARWVAAALPNNRATLLRLSDETAAFLLGEDSTTIMQVVFSADSKLLAIGHGNGVIEVWDVETQSLAHRISSYRKPVRGLAFSLDSSLLATAATGGDDLIRVWDLATDSIILEFGNDSAGLCSLAFSGDGSQLASSSFDRTLTLWDPAAGNAISRFHGHSQVAAGLALSPCAPIVASGSNDTTVRLWDMETGANLATLHNHAGAVFRVAFSPDGSLLASSATDFSVIIWGLPD